MKTTINNKSLGVWLPKKLFDNLKKAIEENNNSKDKHRLNLAKAAYIVNLLYYIPLTREEKYKDGWIPLCSHVLNRIHNYKIYITFLQDNGFLNKDFKNYDTIKGKCTRYKLGNAYEKSVIGFQSITDNSHFIKKTNEYKNNRMNIANIKCPHLTKWFIPEQLTICEQEAMHYIRDTYQKNPKKDFKRDKRIYTIEAIKNQYWTYSRDGLDDRLHSIFTTIPKDLRSFIKYNKEELISLDIRNSQPFIYSAILNQIINPSVNRLNNFLSSRYNILHTSIMSEVFKKTLDRDAIKDFIHLVISGTFYEDYGKVLFEEGLISKDIFGHCYISKPEEIKGTWVRNYEKFESLRDSGKEMIIQTLYSSEGYNSSFTNVFKKHFPEVYRITQFIKVNQEKNFFPVLLQNIEANCVLDYCTKQMSTKQPDMPLFTIHDSIVTTHHYKEILEKEFPELLTKYFGISPKLKTERWSGLIDKAS